jgi:pilus assembly protein Flp/PilA
MEGFAMKQALVKFWKEEEGQALSEYGLILGIIAIAAIAGLVAMKDKIVKVFKDIADGLGKGS